MVGITFMVFITFMGDTDACNLFEGGRLCVIGNLCNAYTKELWYILNKAAA